MKTNKSRSCSRIAARLGFLALLPLTAMGDGGGGGRIQTPYADPKNVTVEEVERVKKLSSSLRDAFIYGEDQDESSYFLHVGLAYLKNDGTGMPVLHEFGGLTEKGDRAVVDFSEVDRFKILQRDGDDFVFEITVFPQIEPAELLKEQPSYSALVLKYKKVLTLRLRAKSEASELALVGKDYSGEQKLIPIRKIKPNTDIPLEFKNNRRAEDEAHLSGPAIWFAIGSVISDPAYPYRVVFKN